MISSCQYDMSCICFFSFLVVSSPTRGKWTRHKTVRIQDPRTKFPGFFPCIESLGWDVIPGSLRSYRWCYGLYGREEDIWMIVVYWFLKACWFQKRSIWKNMIPEGLFEKMILEVDMHRIWEHERCWPNWGSPKVCWTCFFCWKTSGIFGPLILDKPKTITPSSLNTANQVSTLQFVRKNGFAYINVSSQWYELTVIRAKNVCWGLSEILSIWPDLGCDVFFLSDLSWHGNLRSNMFRWRIPRAMCAEYEARSGEVIFKSG